MFFSFRNKENLIYPFFDWNHRPQKAAIIAIILISVLEVIHLFINIILKFRVLLYKKVMRHEKIKRQSSDRISSPQVHQALI